MTPPQIHFFTVTRYSKNADVNYDIFLLAQQATDQTNPSFSFCSVHFRCLLLE